MTEYQRCATATEADRQIGERVRARRVLAGMTQSTLGQHLGVSFQQVQKYEKGTNRVPAARLRQIAAALDTPVTHFYDAIEDGHAASFLHMTVDDQATDHAPAAQRLRLMRAFGGIEDALVRQRVIDLVETIAGPR